MSRLIAFALLCYLSTVINGARYMGCYRDISLSARLLPHHQKVFPGTLTPEVCIDHCLTNGMTYAGLQYGKECFCSDERPPFTSVAPDQDCDMTCEGDASQKCGGGFRLSVHEIHGQTGNHVIKNRVGCYEDSRTNRLLPKKRWEYRAYLTPELCMGHCWRNGYRYAGLYSGKECHCGDSIQARNPIDLSQCNIACPGDRNVKCGGPSRIEVYHTGIPDYSDEENLIGCYTDDQEIRLLSGGSFKLTENNTPRKCLNLCYSLGYRYSGVQYKVECFCGNRKPPNNREVGENECQTRCPGQENEYCGGNFRLLVYKTGKGSSDHRTTTTQAPYSHIQTINSTRPVRPVTTRKTTARPLKEPSIDNYPDVSDENYTPVQSLSVQQNNRPKNCELSVSTVNGKPVCKGSLIFMEDFNTNLNKQKWFHNIFMPKNPDYEFVVFTKRTTNSYLKNGRLHIKPTLLDDDTVRAGKLNLPDCTGELHTDQCERQAVAFNFLPPIESARITTEDFVSFKYGRVDITAKLPSGDWIVPELWLEPKRNIYGVDYASGRIRIASVRGNPDLTLGERQIGARILECGVLVGQSDMIRGRSVFRNSTRLWTHDFHTFTVIWTPTNISFMVDGSEKQSLIPSTQDKLVNLMDFTQADWLSGSYSQIAPFDQEFYLSIGLSVGGMRNFPDGCISGGRKKPWKNMGVKALVNFYQAKDSWYGTWDDEDSSLLIDKIKITAL